MGRKINIGHIRKRSDKHGNDRFQIIIEVWRNGKKHYTSRTFATEKEATKWGAQKHYEIERGIATTETLKRRRLSDAIDKYISEVLPQKPKNARNVEQHLRYWNQELGRTQLAELTPSMVSTCRDKLLKEPTHQSEKRAPATVVRYLSSLSALFETAMKDWNWIEKNPVRQIRKPSVSNAVTRFLEEAEVRRLLNACKESRNPYLYSIVTLAISTGMRRGEILGLRWEDIDFDKKLIKLQKTKNGTVRYIPMITTVFQILKNLADKELEINPSYHIFPSLNLGKYLDIRTAWLFALKRANIDDFTFHCLRHCCASFLAMSGASQRDIAEILGHKDLRMTQRYSHLSQSHLAERLENASEKFINAEV